MCADAPETARKAVRLRGTRDAGLAARSTVHLPRSVCSGSVQGAGWKVLGRCACSPPPRIARAPTACACSAMTSVDARLRMRVARIHPQTRTSCPAKPEFQPRQQISQHRRTVRCRRLAPPAQRIDPEAQAWISSGARLRDDAGPRGSSLPHRPPCSGCIAGGILRCSVHGAPPGPRAAWLTRV